MSKVTLDSMHHWNAYLKYGVFDTYPDSAVDKYARDDTSDDFLATSNKKFPRGVGTVFRVPNPETFGHSLCQWNLVKDCRELLIYGDGERFF